MYALVKDNKVVELHDELPTNWNNISGLHACTKQELIALGWYEVELDTRSFSHSEQAIVSTEYLITNDKVKQVHNIQFVKDDVNLQARVWGAIRFKRDELMKNFEWRYARYEREVRLGLTPSDDLEKMDQYMQQLADVTNQKDPQSIQWPAYN